VAKTLQLEVGGKLRMGLISPVGGGYPFFKNMINGHHTIVDIGWGSVSPQHIATIISSILQLPPAINLPEITIAPTLQFY